MRKIKIAQIGTNPNSHGQDILNCMKNMPDLFDIVGYALPENESEKFPDCMEIFEKIPQMTVEEILNNPDIEAVTIETEEIYLTKYAILAAEHKKHIHIEKPGGLNLKEFEYLISVAKKNNTILHFGYMYRYNPYIMRLMDRIKNGQLGRIICVEAQMNCYHTLPLRQWLKTFKGGTMFFLGCHLIDMILQIQGEPENIISLSRASEVDGIDSEDFGMAVFEYKNGVSFAKTSSVELGGFTRRQLVVAGTKGTIEIRPLEFFEEFPKQTTGYREVFSNDWLADSKIEFTDEFCRYDDMMISFAEMVSGKKENPYSYDYELMLYKCILKACGM